MRVPAEYPLKSVRPSVCPSAVCLPVCVNTFENSVDYHEFWYWELLVKCVDLVQVWLKSSDILHGGLHIFLSACISLYNYQSEKLFLYFIYICYILCPTWIFRKSFGFLRHMKVIERARIIIVCTHILTCLLILFLVSFISCLLDAFSYVNKKMVNDKRVCVCLTTHLCLLRD